MARGKDARLNDQFDVEHELEDAYGNVLKLIAQRRAAKPAWTDKQIRKYLHRLPGLSREAIDQLVAGKMPKVNET